MDASGPYNVTVEVNLSGLLISWKRHVNQLKRCFEDVTIPNNTQEQTDHGNISEEEEDLEEENNTSGVTEVWTNLNPAEQSPTQTNNTPRQNPPRNRKAPDRLTY